MDKPWWLKMSSNDRRRIEKRETFKPQYDSVFCCCCCCFVLFFYLSTLQRTPQLKEQLQTS